MTVTIKFSAGVDGAPDNYEVVNEAGETVAQEPTLALAIQDAHSLYGEGVEINPEGTAPAAPTPPPAPPAEPVVPTDVPPTPTA